MVDSVLRFMQGSVRPIVTIAIVAGVVGNYTFGDKETGQALATFAGPIVGFWFASRVNNTQ